MAGSKTQYLAQKILDHCLGATIWTPPATVYVVLSTAYFDPTATGAACNEIAAGGYARVAVTNDAAHWPAASAAVPAVKANANDIAWTAATADWGTPLAAYLADAGSAGNLLYGCDISSSSDVSTGAVFKIYAGTFIFSED